MKVGDYVRTKYGIAKIKEYEAKENDDNCYYLDNNILDNDEYLGHCLYDYKYYLKQVIKSSPNIIDLIEVGDYVNGERVTPLMIRMRDEQGVFGLPDNCEIYINEIKVKSIVTKEQFSQMEYRIGE